MVTTESLDSAASRAGCKYSQLHMRYIQSLTHPSTHVKRERTERKTSRLQAHKQPHQEGLAFCLRVILDSDAHQWVQAGHPRYTGASAEEGRGWPDVTSTKTTNDNRGQDTDKRQDKRACNDQVLRNVNSHTVVLDSCTINHTFFFSINHTFFSQSITPSFFLQSHLLFFLQSHPSFFLSVTPFFFLSHTFFCSSITPFFFFLNHTFFINQSQPLLFFFSQLITLFFLNQSHLIFSQSINHTFFFFFSINLTFFSLSITLFFSINQSHLFSQSITPVFFQSITPSFFLNL